MSFAGYPTEVERRTEEPGMLQSAGSQGQTWLSGWKHQRMKASSGLGWRPQSSDLLAASAIAWGDALSLVSRRVLTLQGRVCPAEVRGVGSGWNEIPALWFLFYFSFFFLTWWVQCLWKKQAFLSKVFPLKTSSGLIDLFGNLSQAFPNPFHSTAGGKKARTRFNPQWKEFQAPAS